MTLVYKVASRTHPKTPMPRKAPRTREQKLQYVADLMVETASRYEMSVLEVGFPPLSIAEKGNSCDSHGRRVSCLECNFNRCQVCGKPLHRLTLWKGVCNVHQTVPRSAAQFAEIAEVLHRIVASQ